MQKILNNKWRILGIDLARYQYNKPKSEIKIIGNKKLSLFNEKQFSQIVKIIKNSKNPYPKNSAYYQAILQQIIKQSQVNTRIMGEHGETIHLFLEEIMDRIKIMNARQLSDVLNLLQLRPKVLRFDKQLLLSIHVRFQSRILQLIQLNESCRHSAQQQLSIQLIKYYTQGLFYLKRNTKILHHILRYVYNLINYYRLTTNRNDQDSVHFLQKQIKMLKQIFQIINKVLDDTIDPIRQSIIQFVKGNYQKGTLDMNPEILRMIVKCKFYKNFPIVRNQDWIHNYIEGYLKKLIQQQATTRIREMVNVLKSCIIHAMHLDPWKQNTFLPRIEAAYVLVKQKILGSSYIYSKQVLQQQGNQVSFVIKLIPSYLFLKNYKLINTTQDLYQNRVNHTYIKNVIQELKPLINRFILCFFRKDGIDNHQDIQHKTSNDQNSQQGETFQRVQRNAIFLANVVKDFTDPQTLFDKSLENLLNIVTVFKDYLIVSIDPDFAIQLIETQIIYSIVCRELIDDQVRFLRLLQHTITVISQFQERIKNKEEIYLKYESKIKQLKQKMSSQIVTYDNVQKTYKGFTVLRLVSILKFMGLPQKNLGQVYSSIRQKKLNIYIQTLSRTMLKSFNKNQIIQCFKEIFQNKLQVNQIQLGRIVFLTSKQPQLLKYWMYTNRQQFKRRVCFCRRIILNIVSIIRMDNLEINRNSIQILAEIVIENKLFQITNFNHSRKDYNQLKKTMCNNFSILFRYSKMDSMIDDVFVVDKNNPAHFRGKFGHIEILKILTFSAYLSQEQSIFYINRQNKNALFKYVIMLMRKVPYYHKQKSHYLLKNGFNDQYLILDVVSMIIQRYWPDNKMMNKSMPFYAQFLSFYLKINKFDELTKNKNALFLIIKEIVHDYKQVTTNKQGKHIVSRFTHNYQRLLVLDVFMALNDLKAQLDNVAISMNFAFDINIFSEYSKLIENQIKTQIAQYKQSNQQVEKYDSLRFKQQCINKNLINRLVMQELTSLDGYSQHEILSLLTIDILVQGLRSNISQNMKLVVKEVLKLDVLQLNSPNIQNTCYPYSLFKVVLSNLSIYINNRQKRVSQNKQIIQPCESDDKVREWVTKVLIGYAKSFNNNQELLEIVRNLNYWRVDVLRLIQYGLLDMRQGLANLAAIYSDVEILSIFFTQNLLQFNYLSKSNNSNTKNTHLIQEFNNFNILSYISSIIKQFKQSHLMNNYGVYFNVDGQKILNIMRSLLLMIYQSQKSNLELQKQIKKSIIQIQGLHTQFLQIRQKVNKVKLDKNKYISKKSGSNKNESKKGYMDPKQRQTLKKELNKSTQKQLITVANSPFSLIIQVLMQEIMPKLTNKSEQFLSQIKQINKLISKKQSENTQSQNIKLLAQENLLIMYQFNDLGLELLFDQSTQSQHLNFYYLVANQSLLYDFTKRTSDRFVGEEHLTIIYLQKIISQSDQISDKRIRIHPLSNELNLKQYKAIIKKNQQS